MTTITLRQVQKLLAFFGGEDREVVLTEQSQDGAGGSPGLYAHCAEYPEEGCKYLGPTEVDGEIAGADFRRMFGAAVASLAQISEALGIDEEEAACANGNELILKAIARKNAAILAAVQRKASSLALRRLTLDEACEVAPDTMMSQSERIQHKFCEVNGLPPPGHSSGVAPTDGEQR